MLLERDANTVFPGSFCDIPCGQDVLLQVFVHLERKGKLVGNLLGKRTADVLGSDLAFTPDVGDYRSHVL